jgi:oxygen-independent coproporphyrinogen-3 oxidase
LNEYIMTALRTMEGVDLDYVRDNYGGNFAAKIIAGTEKYIASEKLRLKNGKLVLTNEGKLFADGIAGDLFF